jgi:RNase adaptor protein for sRNA GlmZ degradation
MKRLQNDILIRKEYVALVNDIVLYIESYFQKEEHDIKQNLNFKLKIAIGCDEGRHRSVAVVEQIFARLSHLGIPANRLHRDLDTRRKKKLFERDVAKSRAEKYMPMSQFE